MLWFYIIIIIIYILFVIHLYILFRFFFGYFVSFYRSVYIVTKWICSWFTNWLNFDWQWSHIHVNYIKRILSFFSLLFLFVYFPLHYRIAFNEEKRRKEKKQFRHAQILFAFKYQKTTTTKYKKTVCIVIFGKKKKIVKAVRTL